MSQQAVSAGVIPNSAVGIFSPKTEGTRTNANSAVGTKTYKQLGYTDKLVTAQI